MAFHTKNHIFRRIHCDHHRNDTFYIQFSTLEEKTQRMETASAKRYRNWLYRRLKYCLQSNWKRSNKICLGRRSGGIPSDFLETKNRSTMTTIKQTFREIVFLFFLKLLAIVSKCLYAIESRPSIWRDRLKSRTNEKRGTHKWGNDAWW